MGPLDLPDLVRSLVADASHNHGDAINLNQTVCATPIEHISGRISICNIASLRRPDSLQVPQDIALLCLTPKDPSVLIGTAGVVSEASKMLCIQTPDGKKGQHHFLTTVLPRSMPFIQRHLQNQRTICIACNTGTDISIGVAVAALALFFRSDGSCCAQGNGREDMCT